MAGAAAEGGARQHAKQCDLQCRLVLDVIVGKRAAIFQHVTFKDEALVVRWDSRFVLDICLQVFDGVAGLTYNMILAGLANSDDNLHPAKGWSQFADDDSFRWADQFAYVLN